MEIDLDRKKHMTNYANTLTGEQHLVKLKSVTKTVSFV